ncbi:MAG: DUF3108 domain-containing protein [Gammaproteobacteria bacterium]|nr:DUF3108 domain-containing protein [Gammaproteobacteria bacterium]
MSIRYAWLALLFVLLQPAMVEAEADVSTGEVMPRALAEFEAVYKVRASIASGEMSMSFKAMDGGGFLFRTLTSPRGLVRMFARGEIDESSEVVIAGDSIVPLNYTVRDTISKNHDANIRFDWDSGTVAGVERGEDVSGDLRPGMLNRAALYVAIMRDLKLNRLPEQYVLFDRGQIKAYQLENLGKEYVEVPYGRFEAVKLVRDSDNSRRSMYLWCAPELDYLPIRIELYKDDKRVSRADLRAVTGLPASGQVQGPR